MHNANTKLSISVQGTDSLGDIAYSTHPTGAKHGNAPSPGCSEPGTCLPEWEWK